MSNFKRYVKRQKLQHIYEVDARKRNTDRQVRQRAAMLRAFKQELQKAIATGKVQVAPVAKEYRTQSAAQG